MKKVLLLPTTTDRSLSISKCGTQYLRQTRTLPRKASSSLNVLSDDIGMEILLTGLNFFPNDVILFQENVPATVESVLVLMPHIVKVV